MRTGCCLIRVSQSLSANLHLAEHTATWRAGAGLFEFARGLGKDFLTEVVLGQFPGAMRSACFIAQSVALQRAPIVR